MQSLLHKYITTSIVVDDGDPIVMTGRVRELLSDNILFMEYVEMRPGVDTPQRSYLLDVRDLASDPVEVQVFDTLDDCRKFYDYVEERQEEQMREVGQQLVATIGGGDFDDDDDLPGGRPLRRTRQRRH